jgi:hypothetical protein
MSFQAPIFLAGLVAIPLARGGGTVVAKVHVDRLPLASLPGTAELLAGTGHPSAVAVIGGLTLAGIVVLAVRARLFAPYLIAVCGVQLLTTAAGGAAAVHVPIVIARYLVVVLPLLAIFPAAALVAALRVRGDPQATALGGALAAVLLWLGPLGWIYEAPNEFSNFAGYQADYVPGRYFDRFRPDPIPAFYTDVLAARPRGTVTIVEAPWHYYFQSLAYLQSVHRQHVVVGFVGERTSAVRDGELSATEPGIRLRRGVRLDDRAGLRARGVDFVILHRDVRTELRWISTVSETPIDMTSWEARYREWFGAPVFSDSRIVVFAVSSAS